MEAPKVQRSKGLNSSMLSAEKKKLQLYSRFHCSLEVGEGGFGILC